VEKMMASDAARLDDRRYVLLKRLDSLTRAEMLDHWLHPHAELIASLPVFWAFTSRYIQNHVLPCDLFISSDGTFDGIVETWQRKRENSTTLFADEPVYHGPVRADERTFLSMSETVALLTTVRDVIPGPETGVKILSFVRRRPELSHQDFSDWWEGPYAQLVKQSVVFRRALVRYQQCTCIPAMERGFSEAKPVYGFDGVSEMRFHSLEELGKAFRSGDYVQRIRFDEVDHILEPLTFLVKEIEIPPSNQ
jgi:hypothetical protein